MNGTLGIDFCTSEAYMVCCKRPKGCQMEEWASSHDEDMAKSIV